MASHLRKYENVNSSQAVQVTVDMLTNSELGGDQVFTHAFKGARLPAEIPATAGGRGVHQVAKSLEAQIRQYSEVCLESINTKAMKEVP